MDGMNTSRRWREGLWAVVVLLLVITPCLGQQIPKGKLIIAVSTTFGMNGGDCHTSNGGLAATMNYLLHDQLAKMSIEGGLQPAIAKSLKFSKDAMSLEILVDDKAKFHDGTSVTAEDVKFSIERAIKPELKFVVGGDIRRNLGQIDIINEHKLIIHFKKPFPGFLTRGAPYLGIVPKKYVERVGDKEFAMKPIGAGPFKMVEFKQDVYAEFEAVNGHYRKTPNVKRVRLLCIQEDATRLAMLKAGEADVIMLPYSNIPEVESDPNLRIVWGKFAYMDSLAFYDLAFPDKRTPFFDVRVRRATSLAINRKAICQKILNGGAEPWGDILAPYNPGCDPTIPPPEYNPDKAKSLLKEAGFPNGFETVINGSPRVKLQTEAVAVNLAQAGIKAKVIVPEYGIYNRWIKEKGLKGIGVHLNPWWAGQTHPGVALQSTISSASYWSYFTDKESEALLNKVEVLADEEEIAKVAKESSKTYRAAEIRYPLWALHGSFAVGKRVKNWKPVAGWFYPGGLEYLELEN